MKGCDLDEGGDTSTMIQMPHAPNTPDLRNVREQSPLSEGEQYQMRALTKTIWDILHGQSVWNHQGVSERL